MVAEAVEIYRARELEAELEEAYREDAGETKALNLEWQSADAQIDAEASGPRAYSTRTS